MTLTLHATDDRLSGEVLARWRAQTRRFSAACFVQKAPSGGTRPLLCPCELRTLRGSWLRLQAQTQHAPVQFATDLEVCSRAFEGSREELLETRKNGLIHRCRGRHSGVKLVERDDASKTDVLCDVLQSLARFGHEHECETADSRIERPLWIDQPSVRVEELDIVDTLLNTASPRPLGRQRRGRPRPPDPRVRR